MVVLGLCLMMDHIHGLCVLDSHRQLSALMRDCASRYARAFNMSSQRKGQVFDKSFGSAVKSGSKKIRTTIAYLYNNPVEKKLCRKAEEYKWNFLAYYGNLHPFSKPLSYRSSRRTVQRAIKEIDVARADDKPLSYSFLSRVMGNMTPDERLQLTDYIISVYNCIDYAALFSYYNSVDDFLLAVHSNTGSEYDIKEISTSGDDKIYLKMTRSLAEEYGINNPKSLLEKSKAEKIAIAEGLSAHTLASHWQISKYLWLNNKRVTKSRPLKRRT